LLKGINPVVEGRDGARSDFGAQFGVICQIFQIPNGISPPVLKVTDLRIQGNNSGLQRFQGLISFPTRQDLLEVLSLREISENHRHTFIGHCC
jgi:hypothetical protein